MNELRELWARKKEPQGRLDITLFFVNIFLVLCQIFFLIIYYIVGHKVLIIFSIVSILYFVVCYKLCYKKPLNYVGITLLQVLIHLILGTLNYGWTPCYQNWLFAMLIAFFLPSYNPKLEKRTNKSVVFYSIVIVATYLIMLYLSFYSSHWVVSRLPLTLEKIVAFSNSIITFICIIMFALYYTNSSRKKEKELVRKADFDELTGLYNRHALLQLSEYIIEEAKDNKKNYSVAILDIDFFKKINDTYGHKTGDDILKQLAKILQNHNKKYVVGRWGGEEFVIIAPQDVKYSGFINSLDKLRIKVSKTEFITDDGPLSVTISIGASHIKNSSDLEDGVNKADENLYKAKNKGRNRTIG